MYLLFLRSQAFLARDICSGLEYLHSQNVVHRDLKPENILVSNLHYAQNMDIEEHWLKKPVVAKLTDFGESRSELIQTNSRIHTRTVNVKRGSPIFMAPELHISTSDSLTMDELKAVDVWALGMVFYLLVNPNLKHPFQTEMDELRERGISSSLVWHIMKKGKAPEHHLKYKGERETNWKSVVDAFTASSRFESDKRPSATQIARLLQNPLSKYDIIH